MKVTYLFLSCWPVGSSRLPNIARYPPCSSLAFRKWWWQPIAKDTTSLLYKRQKNQAGIDLKASWLLNIFPSAGRCYAQNQRKKLINSLTHLWALWATVMTVLTRSIHRCKNNMNFMGVANNSPTGIKAHTMRWNSGLAMTPRPRNLGQVSQRP